MLICDRTALLDEIDRVYQEHYASSYDQTVHDIFRAVRRRIRRYTVNDRPDIITARLRRNDLDYNEWILSVLVEICGKRHQLMIRLPKEIYDTKCTNVEVKR